MKYYIGGNRVKGEEHFGKALGLIDRLTAREKLWIHAVVEDWRGNRELGIQNYKVYLAQYPDDSAAWFRLGYAYMVSGRYELGVDGLPAGDRDRQGFGERLRQPGHMLQLPEQARRGPGRTTRRPSR